MVYKIIDEFNGRQILVGFDQNQIREILQGFQYEIMSKIGRERGVRRRLVEEGEVNIRFNLMR